MYKELFESSPDAMIVADLEGRILLVNRKAESMFGYRQDEFLGQSIELLVPERLRELHQEHFKNYRANPRVRPLGTGLTLYARRKDGTEFPVDIMLNPVETPEGVLVASVLRDGAAHEHFPRDPQPSGERFRLLEEKDCLEEELQTEYNFDEIVGESPALKRVLKEVERVAPSDATVMILGETGTGKELIARAIHGLSPRRSRTFVKINCAAIPTGLLESELFGYEKGAFTGALATKIGRLELSHRGTLFLDEVGDIPLELQPKLLRALQEKEFERLGSTRTIPVDVRLIAATNRDLHEMVKRREFRSDLYYRLRVFPITVPPLRERTEDIPRLAHYFLQKHARRMNKPIHTIPAQTMRALVQWSWPGNIRELENLIERAVILSKGAVLQISTHELKQSENVELGPASTLEAAERRHILRVFREARGVIGGLRGAAVRLGLKRTTLAYKMKKLGITRRDL